MLLTTEEAREKICPQFLTRIMSDFSDIYAVKLGNKEEIDKAIKEYGKATTCNASDCMAWRWHEYRGDIGTKYLTGYCGLGGKP